MDVSACRYPTNSTSWEELKFRISLPITAASLPWSHIRNVDQDPGGILFRVVNS